MKAENAVKIVPEQHNINSLNRTDNSVQDRSRRTEMANSSKTVHNIINNAPKSEKPANDFEMQKTRIEPIHTGDIKASHGASLNPGAGGNHGFNPESVWMPDDAPVKSEKKSADNSKTRISQPVEKFEDDSFSEKPIDVPQSGIRSKLFQKMGAGSLPSLIKALVYIISVLLVSVILSVIFINVANDVFALKKSSENISVTVEDYPNIDSIADLLEKKGVIKFPSIFKLYAKVRGKDDINFTVGDYVVTPSMNYDQLLTAFVPKKASHTQVTVTIPEGYCVDDIIDLMVKSGIGTKEGFIKAINEGTYDYWFLEGVEMTDKRTYRLEGYLYPDTYYFWSDSTETAAINKMLDNFSLKFKKKYLEQCNKLGMSLDQVITLASLIEAEGAYSEEFTTISSVFHNRLNSYAFVKLQSDATIQYAMRHFDGERKKKLTAEDLSYNSYYNTYIYDRLPPGPITNPTIAAISAAMYPADTGYYYFVADKDGHSLFAKTLTEHQANVAKVQHEEDE